MTALLSITIASYYSIKRLALKYFPYVPEEHKLNQFGIMSLQKLMNSLLQTGLDQLYPCA